MTNPPNVEAPHLILQSGGASQGSVLARSFIIANENTTILNTIAIAIKKQLPL